MGGMIPAALLLSLAVSSAAPTTPEEKAMAFLGREVPRWSRENHCFSCHNNGDAARAIMTAARAGIAPPTPDPLADTLVWLARPDSWSEHEADSPNKDARLARVQFASALALAVKTGRMNDRTPLLRAAEALMGDQSPDGSWPVAASGGLGSPATYGPPLATAMARNALEIADPTRFAEPIARADRWLASRPPRNVLDASALLLSGSPKPDTPPTPEARRNLEFLVRSQLDDGGWGPYPRNPAEAFDTALAILALARSRSEPNAVEAMRRGRAYLLSLQDDEGGWPETTRPSGGESYAQRLSTTGWALMALVESGSSTISSPRK